jgi:hypothetical protein
MFHCRTALHCFPFLIHHCPTVSVSYCLIVPLSFYLFALLFTALLSHCLLVRLLPVPLPSLPYCFNVLATLSPTDNENGEIAIYSLQFSHPLLHNPILPPAPAPLPPGWVNRCSGLVRNMYNRFLHRLLYINVTKPFLGELSK